MMLFKRKPFFLIPPQNNIPNNAEVFVMRGTGEVFTDYEKYLKRYDYLSQKKFVDAVNGKSGSLGMSSFNKTLCLLLSPDTLFPVVVLVQARRRLMMGNVSYLQQVRTSVFWPCLDVRNRVPATSTSMSISGKRRVLYLKRRQQVYPGSAWMCGPEQKSVLYLKQRKRVFPSSAWMCGLQHKQGGLVYLSPAGGDYYISSKTRTVYLQQRTSVSSSTGMAGLCLQQENRVYPGRAIMCAADETTSHQ
jgi:hypothetical protein